MTALQVTGQYAVEAIFYTSIVFIAAISTFWPWWRSQLGWTITAKTLALVIAVTPAMLEYWFGPTVYKDAPWLAWVTVAALACVPPVLAWRAIILWRIQRHQRDPL